MQIIANRSALAEALGAARKALATRNTIPILTHTLLSASDGALSIRATDLDIDIAVTIPCTVEASGAVAVPSTLHDIIRKIATDDVKLIASNGLIGIHAGRARFQLPTLDAIDMPQIVPPAPQVHYAIESALLRRLLARTSFAISTEETRYYLNGIYLHVVEGAGVPQLTTVATDGHRLARDRIACPVDARGQQPVIVPTKAVAELLRILPKDGNVSVTCDANKIQVVVGDITLISKLIDGTFPDYGRVIPQDNNRFASVAREELLAAVELVTTIASDKTKAVKLTWAANALTVSHTHEGNQGNESVAAIYALDDFDLGFQSKYVIDMAKAIEGDRLQILMDGPSSPTLFSNPEHADHLVVLMPMRV